MAGEGEAEGAGAEKLLTKKLGPLPVWAWVVGASAAGYLGLTYLRSRQGSSPGSSSASTQAPGTVPAGTGVGNPDPLATALADLGDVLSQLQMTPSGVTAPPAPPPTSTSTSTSTPPAGITLDASHRYQLVGTLWWDTQGHVWMPAGWSPGQSTTPTTTVRQPPGAQQQRQQSSTHDTTPSRVPIDRKVSRDPLSGLSGRPFSHAATAPVTSMSPHVALTATPLSRSATASTPSGETASTPLLTRSAPMIGASQLTARPGTVSRTTSAPRAPSVPVPVRSVSVPAISHPLVTSGLHWQHVSSIPAGAGGGYPVRTGTTPAGTGSVRGVPAHQIQIGRKP